MATDENWRHDSVYGDIHWCNSVFPTLILFVNHEQTPSSRAFFFLCLYHSKIVLIFDHTKIMIKPLSFLMVDSYIFPWEHIWTHSKDGHAEDKYKNIKDTPPHWRTEGELPGKAPLPVIRFSEDNLGVWKYARRFRTMLLLAMAMGLSTSPDGGRISQRLTVFNIRWQ